MDSTSTSDAGRTDGLPIVLGANRPPDRFYRGGRRLAALRGEADEPTHEPEDWIGSTTHVFGTPGLGETVLPDGRRLVDAIGADPVGWLGAAHAERWGSDPRLLVKLLDAGQRLPVHAHPDGAFAAAHLGRPHGKTEAWVILEGGTVHLGLRRDLGADELARLTGEQRTAEMLALLHAIDVAPGDAVLVPAGQLHAIGEGVLLLEVQEPEDLSILVEWEGFAIDGAAHGHLGLGFEEALTAVDRRAMPDDVLADLVTRSRDRGRLLPSAADAFFTVERVVAGNTLDAGFAVLFVEQGEARFAGLTLPAGSTAVIPAAAGSIRVGGDARLLVARRPGPAA